MMVSAFPHARAMGRLAFSLGLCALMTLGAAVSAAADPQTDDPAPFTVEQLLTPLGQAGSEAPGNAPQADVEDDPGTAPEPDRVTIIVQLQEGAHGLGVQSDDADAALARHDAVRDEIRALSREALQDAQGEDSLSVQADADPIIELYDYYHAIDGFAVKAPAGILPALRALDGVKNAFVEEELSLDTQDAAELAAANRNALAMGGIDTLSWKGDGQLIAILDSGFDTTHEVLSGTMDAATLAWSESDAARKRSDCVQGGQDALYISAKVPFAYDYGDKDANVVPSNGSLDHGMHVAGIAAANAGQVRGTAPNAQLAFLKVANDFTGSIYGSALIAALDDAVVLQPDVINMSLGSDGGFSAAGSSTYGDIFEKLEAQGCTVCVSAGNSYTSAHGNSSGAGLSPAANPDQGIVSSPASLDSTLAVASVDCAMNRSFFTAADGTQICYVDGDRGDAEGGQTFADLADGEYEYVDAGYGTTGQVEELEKEYGSLRGKLAIVEDKRVFEDSGAVVLSGNRVSNISRLRPAGIIIFNSGKGALESKNIAGTTRPVACIGNEDGLRLRDAAVKKVTVRQGNVAPASTDYQVDAFSSWGPTPELSLKPEVAAPGGNIYSSVLKGKYGEKSGTSMASPYIAGVAAAVRGYIAADARFAGLSDAERADAVMQLIMSTAHPMRDLSLDDGWYSPRQQGAGIVDAAAATASPVLASVEGAARASRPKAELGASDSGEWSFTVKLRNLGDTDQAYAPDAVALSELISDGYFQQVSQDHAGGDISVSFAGSAYDAQAGKVVVPAGGIATVTVSIACSDAFRASVSAAENGSFVDGFVFLRAASEGGVDLSIPYLGFLGDWGAAPVFDAVPGSGADAMLAYSRLMNAATDEPLGRNPLVEGSTTDLDKQVASRVDAERAPGVVVPHVGLLRGPESLRYEYRDADGKAVRTYAYSYVEKTDENNRYVEGYLDPVPTFSGVDDAGRALPDGVYTLAVTAQTAGPGSRGQGIELGFTLDTVAPVISDYQVDDGEGARISFKVADGTFLAGVDFHDPDTGAWFYRVLADDIEATPGEDGTRTYAFSIPVADLHAAWADAGQEGNMPAELLLCAWDYGLNHASMPAATDTDPFTIDGETHELSAYNGDSVHVQVLDGVVSIAAGAFKGSSIRSVEIPASVQRIGDSAFEGCEKLQQVHFADSAQDPSKLVSIGARAFAGTGLAAIALPQGLSALGEAAFEDSTVREASVPGGVTALPKRAFAGSGLQRIVLSAGLESIGAQAFSGCDSLESVVHAVGGEEMSGLPDSVSTIGAEAFAKAGVEELALGAGLRSIGADAFKGSSIAQLVLPDGAGDLSKGALSGMRKMKSVTLGAKVAESALPGLLDGDTALKEIRVTDACTMLTSVDGVLFDADGTALLAFPQGRTGSYGVPSGTSRIAQGAFAGAALSHVSLPQGALTVDARAFEGAALESADLGGATSVGQSAFTGCTRLAAVDFRTDLGALASIGANAFSPSVPLEAVDLPDSVVEVGDGAFSGNAALASVRLGAGFAGSFAAVFKGCGNIAHVEVSQGNARYRADGSVLYGVADGGLSLELSLPGAGLAEYRVLEGTVSIAEGAFKDNAALKRVELPEGLKEIGAAAFSGCTSLSQVTFPQSLEVVNGFYNTAIEEVVLGSNVREVKGSAFNGHNPARIVVAGGRGGTYASSLESGGRMQPIASAFFGEGMAKADFAAGSIAPPQVLVVPSTMTKLVFAKPSGDLAYDAAGIRVYAPRDTAGWKAAKAALSSIGADASTQLLPVEQLGMKGADDMGAANAYAGLLQANGLEVAEPATENPEPSSSSTQAEPKAQKLAGKASISKAVGSKPFALGVASDAPGAKLSYKTSNKKVAVVDAKGKVTLKGAGTCKVTVTSTAKGYAKATKAVTVKATLAKAALTKATKSPKKGKLAVAWKKVAGAQGYQVKVGKKAYAVKGAKALKKTVKAAAGKKAKVQVRAFSKASGKMVYGKWSAAKTVKVG